ncbi:hypothetical protein ABHF33_09565 [Chitinibacter sp. FCG-7]|uniref:DUF2214 family protein n=1 Tax=Chitinibacter mangrovi TaxID=3153927 RepID=A0AAU7F5N1_9NEIS
MSESSLRVLVLFPHLLACCVALGAILLSDAKFLLKRGVLNDQERAALHDLSRVACIALGFLWLTGLSIIAIDFGHFPSWAELVSKPKLIAKLTVVIILSINGYLLHRFVLPHFVQKTDLNQLAHRRIYLMLMLGALSGASWVFAAFLGIARPLTAILGYSGFMVTYLVIVLGAIASASLFAKHIFIPSIPTKPVRQARSRKGQRATA